MKILEKHSLENLRNQKHSKTLDVLIFEIENLSPLAPPNPLEVHSLLAKRRQAKPPSKPQPRAAEKPRKRKAFLKPRDAVEEDERRAKKAKRKAKDHDGDEIFK